MYVYYIYFSLSPPIVSICALLHLNQRRFGPSVQLPSFNWLRQSRVHICIHTYRYVLAVLLGLFAINACILLMSLTTLGRYFFTSAYSDFTQLA